ncbi:MAG: hypothetical protein K0M45_08810 [Candidatus Paracaedibacteraceae bacterium]|nr:hypothetical protein [Candidatus Paracaedibacteraceae bacterium]
MTFRLLIIEKCVINNYAKYRTSWPCGWIYIYNLFFPQVLKVWKTRSTKGLSLEMYILYLLGLILWAVYAWLIDSVSLLITELVTGIFVFYILFHKLRRA